MRSPKKQLIAGLLGLLLLTSCLPTPPVASSPPPSGGVETSTPSVPSDENARVSADVERFHPPVVTGAYAFGAIQADGFLSLWGDLGYLWYEGLGDDSGGVYDSSLRQITAVWLSQWGGLALDEYARLWTFGDYSRGHGGPNRSPVIVLENVVTADIGLDYGVALTEDGSVWIWGITSAYDRTVLAPMQIASNAIGVMAGYTDKVYIISRDGTLWDMGRYYDLVAGTAPAQAIVLEHVKLARDGLMITDEHTLCRLGTDGVPERIMADIASVQDGAGGTLAISTDGGLYYWNDFGEREENPENSGRPPYVPYTAPVKLMDGVACAAAGRQALYVQMDNDWPLRVMDYTQVRDVLAGGSLILAESLPVFMEVVRQTRFYPATATLSLPAVWDGTVAPVPPVLPEPGEPLLDSRARAAAVPDFLDYEQQQLYRRAQCLYLHTFGGETSSVEYFPLSPGDAPDPPDDAREYMERNGMRCLFARGRYRDWALFDTAVHSVFTDAFWARRNEWTAGIPIFMELDGKLVYIDASRGDSYYSDYFPDEFVLLEKTDDLIRFTLIGHYSVPYPRPGETYEERDARLAREFEYTIEYPIEMVRTKDGWRFARFYAAISDEDVIRLGL